ncbi:unnamed protein product [Somion occarium]|uniref:Uncharacterized protein n=1 Tax=Somion occarium TaxID=3059160 RepID=A0ABP1D4J6_9APHY
MSDEYSNSPQLHVENQPEVPKSNTSSWSSAGLSNHRSSSYYTGKRNSDIGFAAFSARNTRSSDLSRGSALSSGSLGRYSFISGRSSGTSSFARVSDISSSISHISLHSVGPSSRRRTQDFTHHSSPAVAKQLAARTSDTPLEGWTEDTDDWAQAIPYVPPVLNPSERSGYQELPRYSEIYPHG